VKKILTLAFAACLAVGLVACAQDMSKEEMMKKEEMIKKEQMKK
jgi:pentapeptide MXKDX repeat protein